jgi:hypothetical protein
MVRPWLFLTDCIRRRSHDMIGGELGDTSYRGKQQTVGSICSDGQGRAAIAMAMDCTC